MTPKEWEQIAYIYEIIHPAIRRPTDRKISGVEMSLFNRLDRIYDAMNALVTECPAPDCCGGWTESWQDDSGEWQGDERCLVCDGLGVIPRRAPSTASVDSIRACISIVDDTPLGYRTHDEHVRLESFATTCISKMRQLLSREQLATQMQLTDAPE